MFVAIIVIIEINTHNVNWKNIYREDDALLELLVWLHVKIKGVKFEYMFTKLLSSNYYSIKTLLLKINL